MDGNNKLIKGVKDITLVASFDTIEYSITYVVESGATNPNNLKKFNVESVVELLNAEWGNDEKRFVGGPPIPGPPSDIICRSTRSSRSS